MEDRRTLAKQGEPAYPRAAMELRISSSDWAGAGDDLAEISFGLEICWYCLVTGKHSEVQVAEEPPSDDARPPSSCWLGARPAQTQLYRWQTAARLWPLSLSTSADRSWTRAGVCRYRRHDQPIPPDGGIPVLRPGAFSRPFADGERCRQLWTQLELPSLWRDGHRQGNSKASFGW